MITVFVLSLLARGAEPGPTVRFDEATLTMVSQSSSYEFREQPMPHYLGSGADETDRSDAPEVLKNTVSLASMTVAADVRGYAGPINLLVSVDEAGILRGVRYIESDETPAYIADIDKWLALLRGRDISYPLTLEDIDALSSATISSRAALESINRGAQAGGQSGFWKIIRYHPQRAGESMANPRISDDASIAHRLFPGVSIRTRRGEAALSGGGTNRAWVLVQCLSN